MIVSRFSAILAINFQKSRFTVTFPHSFWKFWTKNFNCYISKSAFCRGLFLAVFGKKRKEKEKRSWTCNSHNENNVRWGDRVAFKFQNSRLTEAFLRRAVFENFRLVTKTTRKTFCDEIVSRSFGEIPTVTFQKSRFAKRFTRCLWKILTAFVFGFWKISTRNSHDVNSARGRDRDSVQRIELQNWAVKTVPFFPPTCRRGTQKVSDRRIRFRVAGEDVAGRSRER